MSTSASAQAWDPVLSDWEGPAKAAAWKIERHQPAAVDHVAFFPDQNGTVYEHLLAELPLMLHCMDGMGRLTSVNRHWRQSLGYSQEEAQGKLFNDLLTGESRLHLVQTIYPRYFQSGQCRDEEVTLFRKDGSLATARLSMTAYRGDKGRIERSICVLRETGGQPFAAAPAEKGEQRYRSAFAQAAHGMVMVSPSGHIAETNAAFRDLIGRGEAELAAMGFEDLLHKDDCAQFVSAMQQLLAGEAAVKPELRFITGSGQVLHCAASVSLVRGEDGGIDQLVIQVIDMSSRKQAQKQLQQAQKMEAIGQLTGGLAHDFNNLLTVIIGNLQLIDLALKGNDKAHKRALEAIDAAQKGSDLTKQLLAFARRQALEPQEVRINDLADRMAPLVSRTIGETVELKVDLMAGEPKAIIDPSQLESAILNLAINARDAMPEGGLLTIETQPAYLDEAYASRHPEVVAGHYVMVAVSDTGTGISAELLEKVFQPFFTTKEPGRGSGLGLSMVYGFIKQSGGHIQVYSEVGHGTSIKMYLPRIFAPGEALPDVAGIPLAASEPEPTPVPEPASEPEPARKHKILVVEDQEAVRAVACGFLTNFGYDVIEAEDGFQALARLQENPEIDLMFSDVVMPGGMNGFDLAQAAYNLRPNLKVVHTSGYPKGAMVHQEEPRFREGFIIMKPYRREELERIIREALERQD